MHTVTSSPDARGFPEPDAAFGAGSVREAPPWLDILRRRWLSILAVTGLCLGYALWMASGRTPVYRSNTEILVKPVTPDSDGVMSVDSVDMRTEERIAGSFEVALSVIAAERLSLDPHVFLDRLDVVALGESLVLQVSYVDPRPAVAQRVAASIAEAYLEQRHEEALRSAARVREPILERLKQVETEMDRYFRRGDSLSQREQMRLNTLVFEFSSLRASLPPQYPVDAGVVLLPANLPVLPASAGLTDIGVMGALAGLAAGLSLAWIREWFNDHVRGRAELAARLDAPVLGVIPHVSRWQQRRTALVAATSPRSPAAEAFRVLRTNVVFAALRRGARTLLVGGTGIGEGKTNTAANLAVSLAHTGRRIVLIDADLRRPRLHQLFEVSNDRGLSSILRRQTTSGELLLDTGIPNLRIIPSGPLPAQPAELVASESMTELLTTLKRYCDMVIVDAPPLLLADSLALAGAVDAVVLVAAGSTTDRAVVYARSQLEQVGAHLLGSVLNRIRRGRDADDYGYPYRRNRKSRFRPRPVPELEAAVVDSTSAS